MLKTSLMAIAAAALTAGAASAQDWSGFYVGGSISQSSGEADSNVVTGGNWSVEGALRPAFENLMSTSLDPEGTGFGVHGGYNWEFAEKIVVGAEIGYSQLEVDDDRVLGQTATTFGPSPTYAPVNRIEADGQFNIRATVGYDFAHRLLAYGVIGYSSADVTSTTEVLASNGYSKAGQGSDWVEGFTYGLGAAIRFGGPWSARIEYTRTEYDDISYATAYRPGSTFTAPAYTETVTQGLDLDSVRVGVNFHF